jgi:ubiquinone/menaquinone biosynthesis C-methylase UbiE
VLENAALRADDIVLDAGAGDGLIAFGALARLGPSGRVIFNDISQDLLDHARALAAAAGTDDRCDFVNASADELSPLEDESVDVVTTRSVLIYVPDKRRAFSEFYRVLKPSGRISLFEPINRFSHAAMFGEKFFGISVEPVAELWAKVRAIYDRLQPPTDPMLDFDERDLFAFAEQARFREIHMEYRADVTRPQEKLIWDKMIRGSGNPKIPSIAEVLSDALNADERERFVAYFRPRLEGGDEVTYRSAGVYLSATK